MRNHMLYHWWIYMLYTLFTIGIIFTVFNGLSRPKDDEKIIFFIGDTAVYKEMLEVDLLTYLENHNTQNIIDVGVQLADSTAAGFEDILATKALGGIDFVILPDTAVKTNTGQVYFQALDDQKILSYFGNDTVLYREFGQTYGIVLDVGNNDYRLSDYLSIDQQTTYILFFNAFSINIGDWNNENTVNFAALEAVKWLMETGD